MRKIFVLGFAIIALSLSTGCVSLQPTDTQKKALLQVIEQLEKQDRISKTNAEDLKKLLEKNDE